MEEFFSVNCFPKEKFGLLLSGNLASFDFYFDDNWNVYFVRLLIVNDMWLSEEIPELIQSASKSASSPTGAECSILLDKKA